MKSKTLAYIIACVFTILVYYLLFFSNYKSQHNVAQVVVSNQVNALETHTSTQKAVHKSNEEADVSIASDIEKLYPRSSRISWLTDGDIKEAGIDIEKIESKVELGGEIPFPPKISSSEYRIENKFHAASIALTYHAYEARNTPVYGCETNKYYLFFYRNKDTKEIQWARGVTVSKEHPFWSSRWDFRFEK